ncbi:diguanylate cyclase [Xylophilus rhododendri]|uniref:diguanylate cyclase n=1 Tax=Xylophilus rhododendri TaxID=2697032 RepID=A0A857J853_9BURK|nr:diguanylate cyclase [Xylophilus rhododendri]QHI98948.1 diguanylate cyclase [Xylophilus rhododendri]
MTERPPRRQSLGMRLMLATLGFCLVFTLCAAAYQTWSAWRAGKAAMDADLALMERMYGSALAKASWDLDRDQIATYAEILSQAPWVGRVDISVRLPVGPPLEYQRVRPGWTPSSVTPVHRSQLRYEPFTGRTEAVGELRLFGDEARLWRQLREALLGIVVRQALQSLLLASLVMALFHRLVTVHVRRIARHLAQLTPLNLGKPLTIERASRRDDELELLVTGVNQLQNNLSDYLERQQRFEQELAAHRDRLSELVQERTAELETLNRQLEQLSRTDSLTGLANRRSFDQVKLAEFQRARRGGQPLTLVLCDIDYFKRYNDTYGHAGGDACLQAVAAAVQGVAQRGADLVARIGGEEFAILLPGSDGATGLAVAERVREAMAALAIPHAASEVSAYVTLSLGLATLQTDIDANFETLFRRADQALYQAKQDGRDRVRAADLPQAKEPS